MKGALYVLWNKGTAAYALADQVFHGQYLLSLLESQHQEKPSIQKLVGNLGTDCLTHLTEEAVHTDAYTQDTPRIKDALLDLEKEFSSSPIDPDLLTEALQKAPVRVDKRSYTYDRTISAILTVALRRTTHWRYVEMATRFLHALPRRDVHTSPDVAKFFIKHTISPQPTIRVYAQRAVVKLAAFIKIRTYAKSDEQLWLDEWANPLQGCLSVTAEVVRDLQRSVEDDQNGPYVDKIPTGFLTWTPSLKSYSSALQDRSPFSWDDKSLPCLTEISEVLGTDYYTKLVLLWGQESNRNGGKTQLRSENVTFIKTIGQRGSCTPLACD
jgi:proteasome activator subunit 4